MNHLIVWDVVTNRAAVRMNPRGAGWRVNVSMSLPSQAARFVPRNSSTGSPTRIGISCSAEGGTDSALASSFSEIYGSELDGRNTDKADLVRLVLEEERLVPRETWMIGDRAQDVRGGRMNGTRTAGVLWGYGTEQELRKEEPDILLRSVKDLIAHVRCST